MKRSTVYGFLASFAFLVGCFHLGGNYGGSDNHHGVAMVIVASYLVLRKLDAREDERDAERKGGAP